MIKDILYISLIYVKKRGLRSLLTMIQIMLGIATITLIFNLIFGIWDGISTLEGEMGGGIYLLNVVTERPSDRDGRMVSQYHQRLTEKQLQQIQQLPTVEHLSPVDSLWEPLLYAQGEFFRLRKLAFVGPDYHNLLGVQLEEGSFFTISDYEQRSPVGLISRTAARIIYPNRSPLGEEVEIYRHWRSGVLPEPQVFTIIGVFEAEGMEEGYSALSGNQFLVPATLNTQYHHNISYSTVKNTVIQVAEERMGDERETFFDTIALQIKEGSFSQTQTAINRLIQESFGHEYQGRLNAYTRYIEDFRDWAQIISMVLAGFGFLIVIIGSTGILSTMMVGILERTTQIGLEKAMGAPGKFIFLRFTTEALLISLGGWILGILLALLLSDSITQLGGFLPVPIDEGLHPLAALLSLLVALLFGGVFSIYPALQATKMDPVEALRYG